MADSSLHCHNVVIKVLSGAEDWIFFENVWKQQQQQQQKFTEQMLFALSLNCW